MFPAGPLLFVHHDPKIRVEEAWAGRSYLSGHLAPVALLGATPRTLKPQLSGPAVPKEEERKPHGRGLVQRPIQPYEVVRPRTAVGRFHQEMEPSGPGVARAIAPATAAVAPLASSVKQGTAREAIDRPSLSKGSTGTHVPGMAVPRVAVPLISRS